MSGAGLLLGARTRSPWACLWAVLWTFVTALAFAPYATAGAEVAFEIPSPEERGPAPAVVRGSYLPAAAPRDAAGWGYARFSVHNVDSRAHTIVLSAGGRHGGGARVERRLDAGASAQVYLPLLPTEDGVEVQAVVNGVGGWSTSTWTGFGSYRGGSRWDVLVVDERERAKPAVEASFAAALAVLVKTRGALGSRTAEGALVPAEGLPDRWPLLSSSDLIVVEGRRPGLDAERQRVLVRAIAAGGAVVVLSRDGLPPGPLLDLVAGGREPAAGLAAARRGVLGLGRWWSTRETYEIASATGLNLPEPLVALFEEAIEELDLHPRADRGPVLSATGAPIALARFTDALEVPGVGRLPVRVFFFTILGFVLIAGPLSYVLLRRRKRLGAFLVLLPSLGIVFSAAILLYGLLSEGTGIRGCVRSISVLDQRSHEAVTRSGRSLYAAFSPGALRLDPQTLLLSDDFERSSYGYRMGGGTQAILDLDFTDGVSATGTALPSRVPITYDVATVAPARERLRFRAVADGRYEARYAPDFAPVAGPRTIVLRDLDGGWHVGGREGPLTRLEPTDAAAAVRDLLAPVADLPLTEREDPWDEYGGGYRVVIASRSRGTPPATGPSIPASNASWLRGCLPQTLPPGSYVALFERAPAFDDLGLDVAWKRSVHLVHGLLAAEDFGE